MAADFLRSRGIDIDTIMSNIQSGIGHETPDMSEPQATRIISNVRLPGEPRDSTWDVHILNGKISTIAPHRPSDPSSRSIDGDGGLLAPSLCHPHLHLDKAYLLSHPRYADLAISRGDFAEALALTGTAKSRFTPTDLRERGQRVLDESRAAAVTHLRAFVEVDAGVGDMCLAAGIELKRGAEGRGQARVQICAFAQMPLFSASEGDDDGRVIRGLMREAATMPAVECLGSTPYVEDDRGRMEANVAWIVDLCIESRRHLDLHLDYNLDSATEPLVWHVIEVLKAKRWMETNPGKTVVLGHCTRLTLFDSTEWERLKHAIAELPISFVGLPTSDLFMMRSASGARGTLNVPTLIRDHGLNACLGINNIGNAFTPHGSCDPLSLACSGVGVYQAGTKRDAEILFECISTRARRAIGPELADEPTLDATVREGHAANLVLFRSEKPTWRTRGEISEIVYLYDHCQGRRGWLEGRPIN